MKIYMAVDYLAMRIMTTLLSMKHTAREGIPVALFRDLL